MRSLFFVLLAFVLNLPLPAQQTPPCRTGRTGRTRLTITTVAWPDGNDIPLKHTGRRQAGISHAGRGAGGHKRPHPRQGGDGRSFKRPQ